MSYFIRMMMMMMMFWLAVSKLRGAFKPPDYDDDDTRYDDGDHIYGGRWVIMFFYESDADIRSWILDIRYWSDEYESDGSPPTPPPPRSQALDKKPENMYLQFCNSWLMTTMMRGWLHWWLMMLNCKAPQSRPSASCGSPPWAGQKFCNRPEMKMSS